MSVHDLTAAKELLNNPDFEGRPVLELIRARDPDFVMRGIFLTDGLLWKDQSRFTLRHMRDFGFGRRFDELEVHQLNAFVDLVRNGAKYEFKGIWCMATASLSCPLRLDSLAPKNVTTRATGSC